VAALLLALAPLAAAEDGTRLGTLIRWYLHETSPARRQDLLEAIERLAAGDPRPVADAIRAGEHCEFAPRPELRKGGKPPVFDLRRPRLVDVAECAGDFAELVLPTDYTPSRAHPLIVELAPTGLDTPPATILLRVHAENHPQAKTSAEVSDLLVLSLVAHVTEIARVDADRVFLHAASGRSAAALAWAVALHNPDRFAGLLAGPGGWKGGGAVAPNAAFFSSIAVIEDKDERDPFLAAVRKANDTHVTLRADNREENRRAVEAWWERTARPAAPGRIRVVQDRGLPMRAYWLRVVPRVPSLKQEEVGRGWSHRVVAQDATLEAQIAARDFVTVRAERVTAFDLFLDPALLEPGGVVRVQINGQVPEARVARGDIGTLLEDYRDRRDPGLLYWGKLTFTVR
jgi:hypothetical protein